MSTELKSKLRKKRSLTIEQSAKKPAHMDAGTFKIKPARQLILMKSLRWVVAAALIAFGMTFMEAENSVTAGDADVPHEATVEELSFLVFVGLILSCSVLYAVLYRMRFVVRLRSGILKVAHGVVIRRRISLPLGRISQVDLGRDFMHKFFGLYYVDITAPIDDEDEEPKGSFRIPALERDDAVMLKTLIERFIRYRESEIQNFKLSA